ncbi:armadillo-type protein [Trametes polyzona]|nr:armadillo-type protein [Trametes polyzona]
MDSHPDERPAKRFKHQSYKETLKEVHLPSALKQTKFDHDLADNESHFHEALLHWQELNLAPAFLEFARNADPLAASMPLLLHNWREIVELWLAALEKSNDEGLKAILDLFQKLAHDLRTTLAPEYPRVLKRLLQLLPRSLSAEALTALLATFSALFKYVLVPSVDSELLEQAWSAFCEVLPRCHPEVQRATAEVWGATLRRLQVSLRIDCVRILAASSTDVLGDSCAWIFVTACKSVSQTLHTATPTLIAPLIRYHLSSDAPNDSFTLVRRVLTALVHHCKGSEQFAPVSEAVVSSYLEVIKAGDEEQTSRILEVASVVCSVRQGSRMTHKQLSALLAEYPAVPLSDALHASLLKFATSVLTAGEMPLWAAHGRKVLERSWERPVLGIELTGALSDLSWGGWKLVAAPYISSNTHKLLETHPAETLELLAALNREKRLSDMDIVWRQRFQRWVEKALASWEQTEKNVQMLEHVLELSSLLPDVSKLLAHIVDQTLDRPDARLEYESTYANSAWVIGACAQCLSERPVEQWADVVDVSKWTRAVVAKWGWSSRALEGLVPLVQASQSTAQGIPFEDLYAEIKVSLLSHSRSLRLQTLRLLTSPLVQAPEGPSNVLKKALQAEEVSIDVQGVRERVLRINRLPIVVRDGDDVGAEICARWLVAQLKVNLRPLWSPAANALSTLASRFGDLVWDLIFRELQDASTATKDAASDPAWVKEGSEEASDDVWEDERSWRDPSAHRVRTVLAKWLEHSAAEHAIIQSQISGDRFDATTYETQLLGVLEECSSLAEKHNRDLIPYFLSLAGPDALSKMPRFKLTAWLKLLSKFSNPNALRSTEAMRSLYVSLLSHPDRSLQRLALSCVLTYKPPALVSHEDTLRTLLDDTKWRDELTQLEFVQFEPDERPELVSVIIRLLYGMMLEKKGRTRGADRRAAILSTLAGCADDELPLLVDLMLQPIRGVQPPQGDGYAICPVPGEVSPKQQIGFLTLLGDLLKHLGSRVVSKWPPLLETVLDLTANAQASLDAQKDVSLDEVAEEDAAVMEEEQAEEAGGSSRALRSIRQLGLKRFADFFRSPVVYDFSRYLPEAYRACITPRLASLDLENTQSPSALLDLFYAWTQRAEYAGYLVRYDERTLPKIYDCLVATNVKPAVISKVFDVIEQLQSLSISDHNILETVFKPHVSHLLKNLTILVSRSKGSATAVTDLLGRRQIAILSELAPYLSDGSQAKMLLDLFSPLLRKPHKSIPEKIKVDMATILCSLFPLIHELSDADSQVFIKTYALLAQLFQTLRSRQARVALVKAFRRLSEVQPTISRLADLMDRLNGYSTRRIEEPDFDRRLEAFTELNESLHQTFSCRDWLPIIYNMLSFIQDPLELTIRTNAATALKRFVDLVADQQGEYEEMFLRVLYPGVKNGLHSKTELVRAELLGVLSHAVARCTHIASLQEMRVLLAGGDEEANFFNNIHHVQIHRRNRAIRRLAEYADQGHLRSTTLAEVFIPLVGNYVVSTDSVDHHLVNEAITATGQMARHLNWGAYYSLVQRYLKLAKQKDTSEKVYVRAIVAILESFHFPMEETVEEDEITDMAVADEERDAGEDLATDDQPEAEVEGEASKSTRAESTLAGSTEPAYDRSKVARIQDAVNHRLLPSLISYLEKRDETEDSLRIPISTGIVQIAKHLPQEQRDAQITKLLTVLSQVLRSKSQETRDLARSTLCRIAISLGPSYLPLLIREMRAALLRGPHLHVLAYSVHAVLVHVTTGERASVFHTLDECVNDVAAISAEVIFGESGKDVQAEGFKTKMREVRSSSSKGVDSFAILAKFITPPKISSLLLPIRSILQETETLKVMQQVEELLRRIGSGLNSNAHLVPTELLVLCHTLISQNARFLQEVPKARPNGKGRKPKDDALVQVKRRLPSDADHYANNSFRFVAFGLDLFNTAYRRGRFDFKDPQVISRLEPMVTVIGNTLYSSHMQVIVPGLKAAAAIVKCPLKSIDKSLPVFIRQIIDIIKQAGSTEPDTVQTAFKSLATILRDHQSAQVKEKDLVYLLELLAPDLEEPERQAAVFTMLRAIVARRFVVPEIYDIMDKVAEIMVTNQSPQVQELCRGALLQFLLDYPQGKGRLKNQMTFLVKNLSYVYESGRKSVMELLSAIIAKFETGLVQEYGDLVFVGLVMVIANDESAKCREMAAELIKSLLARLETAQRNVIMSHVHTWAVQHSQLQLTRVSAQLYGLIADFLKADVHPYVPSILEDMNGVLRRCAFELESSLVEGNDEEVDADTLASQWQTPYHTLLVLSKVVRDREDLVTQDDKVEWSSVIALLLFPHAWVRTAACRLLGILYAAVPSRAPRDDLPEASPFSRVGMREVAAKLSLQLKSENLDDALGVQVVKNLFYVGKCFYAIELPSHGAVADEDGHDCADQASGDESSGEEGDTAATYDHPLPWLFSKLSYQTRSALIRRRNKSTSPANWSQQPTAILKWFAAMVSYMQADDVGRFLMHILSPIYRIVEDDTVRDPQMDDLKTLAIELQDLVQNKVGTTQFASVYNSIRQKVLAVRRDRRTARVVQNTTNPAAAAKRKLHRNVAKKESRKRKNEVFIQGKGRAKRRRAE